MLMIWDGALSGRQGKFLTCGSVFRYCTISPEGFTRWLDLVQRFPTPATPLPVRIVQFVLRHEF
jgi:hypothetical protein